MPEITLTNHFPFMKDFLKRMMLGEPYSVPAELGRYEIYRQVCLYIQNKKKYDKEIRELKRKEMKKIAGNR